MVAGGGAAGLNRELQRAIGDFESRWERESPLAEAVRPAVQLWTARWLGLGKTTCKGQGAANRAMIRVGRAVRRQSGQPLLQSLEP